MATNGEVSQWRGLENVLVEKDEILRIIRGNRDDHRAIFEKALDGYKSKVIEMLEEHIEHVRNGDPKRVVITIPFPEDHSDDYDRVIKMLELSKDDLLLLDTSEFAQYVLDDWGWKHGWTQTAAMYTSSD